MVSLHEEGDDSTSIGDKIKILKEGVFIKTLKGTCSLMLENGGCKMSF